MTKDPASSTGDGCGGGLRLGDARRSPAVARFATAGCTLGLALGFIEAGLLHWIPRFAALEQPDVTGAIWVIAPLADAPVGALAGLALGGIAVLPRRPRPLWQVIWMALGLGLATAYLGWLFFWFRVGQGVIVPRPSSTLSPALNWAMTPVLYFVVGSAVSAGVFRWALKRARASFRQARHMPHRRVATLDAAVLAGLMLALGVIRWRGREAFPIPSATPAKDTGRNNVALIILDTVRADHLSCYGYARSTTPNLDRLAGRGVLFEDAVAPTSWTLPSLASVLTGLLPHQHAADWYEPMSQEPVTLAEILKARGFETAGFNANPDFGLAGWGLAQGFDVYADAHDWLRHNLAATFAGQSVYQTLFREFVSFNEFDRLNASQINQQVLDWLRQRSSRPYFLFINYMDAHRPYVPPRPFDRRFGRIPKPLLWTIAFALRGGQWNRALSARERQDLIDGYDNSLSYLDAQVGRLLEALEASPDGGRTFVIVAGDHGEGFGEHGSYDHGWDLYREVLHVPLLVAGPGIPAGRRVSGVAELRELFPTVTQLALGNLGPLIAQASLSRFWDPKGEPEAATAPALSELDRWTRHGQKKALLSLSDARWHYILDSRGHAELYDVERDRAETHNLTSSPALEAVARQLRSEMEALLAGSVLPWRNGTYLSALDQPGMPFARLAARNTAAFGLVRWPVGRSQSFFSNRPPAPATRPTPSQEDLLRSLPYH